MVKKRDGSESWRHMPVFGAVFYVPLETKTFIDQNDVDTAGLFGVACDQELTADCVR